MADLITQQYLANSLADYGLTANQTALLPDKAGEASRLVRDWCGRQFTRLTIDEVLSVDPRRPILLREFPVNAVTRVSANPTTVLSVCNSDATTNQRALAKLSTSGDADAGLTVSGLTLTRIASGVSSASTLLFSTYTTIASLAAAIVALGNGWKATAASGYSLWATADLRAVQGNIPALAPSSAELRIHVDDIPFSLDERSGILRISGADDGDPFNAPRWGPQLTSDWGDQRLRPSPGNLRVVYDAGFDAVPGPVQAACVELVKGSLERLRTDSTLASESDGTYAWSARPMAIEALPLSVLQPLALYRSTRA